MGNTATKEMYMPVKAANVMSKKDMKKLEHSTGLDIEKIVDWQKQFYKDFPSGEITEQVFQRYYCDAFPGLNPLSFSERTFRLFDTNNDKIIDFTEFIHSIAHLESPSVESQLTLSFRFYDIENSGTIGPEEMEEIVLALERAVSRETSISEKNAKETANKIFKLLDKDEDGKIEQTEFVYAVLHNNDMQEIFNHLSQQIDACQ